MTSLKQAWPRMRRNIPCRILLLAPLSLAYGLGYWSRRLALKLGPKPAAIPEALVVSVGNLAAGGTGKTPAAIAIGAYHLSKGRRVFFLSRGYGRKGGFEPLLVSAGRGMLTTAEESGDEPAFLAAALPKAGVIVGRDRLVSGRLAVEKFGAQVLILDDGFQQRLFLKRDLDILLWNQAHGGSDSFMLPLGVLREPLGQAAQASAFILTGFSGPGTVPLEAKGKRFFRSTRVSLSVYPLGRPAGSKAAGSLKKMPLASVCGLAEPAGFEASLLRLGADLRWTARFPDHHPYGISDLESVAARARSAGATMLVTTEKDAQRFPARASAGLPVWVLKSELQMSPKPAFEKMLEKAYADKFPARPVKK